LEFEQHSDGVLEKNLALVPEDEKRQIVVGKAIPLFRLNAVAAGR
jgi:hypothetical protein